MTLSFQADAAPALRALYANDVYRPFFDWIAQRRKDRSVTSVDRAVTAAGLPRRDVVRLYQKLEDLGLGTFIFGRLGWQSRFTWSFSLRSVGSIARGEGEILAGVDPAHYEGEDEVTSAHEPRPTLAAEEADGSDDLDEADDLVTYTLPLRSDLAVALRLPAELTAREAERLCTLIRALPVR